MGNGGSCVEYQQTVRVAADDGENGSGYSVEVVALPCGAADAVVLNIQEECCVVGQSADVFWSVARGGNGDGVGRLQTTCDIDGHLFALGHNEDVAARVDLFAKVLDIGAKYAAGVDTGRVDDEQSSLEAADAHLLEGPDDGSLGTREIAAEVAAEVICVDCAFHRCCKDKTRFGGFCY